MDVILCSNVSLVVPKNCSAVPRLPWWINPLISLELGIDSLLHCAQHCTQRTAQHIAYNTAHGTAHSILAQHTALHIAYSTAHSAQLLCACLVAVCLHILFVYALQSATGAIRSCIHNTHLQGHTAHKSYVPAVAGSGATEYVYVIATLALPHSLHSWTLWLPSIASRLIWYFLLRPECPAAGTYWQFRGFACASVSLMYVSG